MTDYELVNMVLTQVQTMFEVLATYITIVSGFLAVGYLVAHKLNRSMVAVLVVLFSMTSLACGSMARNSIMGSNATMAHIAQAIAAGTSHLGWWLAAGNGPVVASIQPITIQAIFVVAYIGTLLFFFVQRRAAQKAAA